jgi:hypothetical protein
VLEKYGPVAGNSDVGREKLVAGNRDVGRQTENGSIAPREIIFRVVSVVLAATLVGPQHSPPLRQLCLSWPPGLGLCLCMDRAKSKAYPL